MPFAKEQLLYERRNGQFTLQITGHLEFGVPFGQDRLVPTFFLGERAVQQKSRAGRFRTAAEMLESSWHAHGWRGVPKARRYL